MPHNNSKTIHKVRLIFGKEKTNRLMKKILKLKIYKCNDIDISSFKKINEHARYFIKHGLKSNCHQIKIHCKKLFPRSLINLITRTSIEHHLDIID